MRSNTRHLFQFASRLRKLVAAFLVSAALAGPAAAVDFTDLWYTVGENAWGINFVQSDKFIFATFFIYGPDNKPTWYTGQVTQDANGVWSGEVNLTNGTYFGAPWNEADKTLARVGTMTFTPSSAIAGTLTYNVNDVNVAKVITRLTLTTPPLGGSYLGGYTVDYTSCNNPAQNGTINGFANYTVTQVLGGNLKIDLQFNGVTGGCTFAGNYALDGQLYRIPNASYVCTGSNPLTAQVSEVKATAQGIEGRWTSAIGEGCIESGYISAVFK
ncbi:MAG: hypothetical protein ABI624_15010 [Casimicrobiaceae bacterium]